MVFVGPPLSPSGASNGSSGLTEVPVSGPAGNWLVTLWLLPIRFAPVDTIVELFEISGPLPGSMLAATIEFSIEAIRLFRIPPPELVASLAEIVV